MRRRIRCGKDLPDRLDEIAQIEGLGQDVIDELSVQP